MKLTEFNRKPSMMAKKALQENFNTSLNFDKLSMSDTRTMLRKVKGLISETRQSNAIHSSEQNPAYLKLVFMEQALAHHYGELRAQPMYNSRIVVENEEVEKSQVVLAVKDMVDSVQKMVEEVSDMLVKELPAVIDSVNSEIGTNEGEQFSSQANEALTTLQAALTQSKTSLQAALGVVTGQGGGFDAGMGGPEMGGMGAEPPMGGEEMGAEMPDMGGDDMGAEMPEEEPEAPPTSVGRAKR
jgi:hypothetical protein